MKKKVIAFFVASLSVVSLCFLLSSCVLNISDNDYIDIAREYLEENFGGEYSLVSIKKISSCNEVHVRFKAENLGRREVNVRIVVSDRQLTSYTTSLSSNYLCIFFEKDEAGYYEGLFKKYFTDCKVSMDNENRFLSYYATYFVQDENSGEWVERKNNVDFERYCNILAEAWDKNHADIIVTEKNHSKYLSSEDKLKCCLVDLQQEGISLDGCFYIVNEIGDDYESSRIFKATINVCKDEYDGFKYVYDIE